MSEPSRSQSVVRSEIEHVCKVLGLATLALLIGLPRVSKKLPAILVAVVVATVITAAFGLAEEGVDTVGTLPQGLPVPSFPWTGWSDLADREGFVVLYPEGIGLLGYLQHWNAGHCCGRARSPGMFSL